MNNVQVVSFWTIKLCYINIHEQNDLNITFHIKSNSHYFHSLKRLSQIFLVFYFFCNINNSSFWNDKLWSLFYLNNMKIPIFRLSFVCNQSTFFQNIDITYHVNSQNSRMPQLNWNSSGRKIALKIWNFEGAEIGKSYDINFLLICF